MKPKRATLDPSKLVLNHNVWKVLARIMWWGLWRFLGPSRVHFFCSLRDERSAFQRISEPGKLVKDANTTDGLIDRCVPSDPALVLMRPFVDIFFFLSLSFQKTQGHLTPSRSVGGLAPIYSGPVKTATGHFLFDTWERGQQHTAGMGT